jgi:hypothetical protein
VTGAELREVRAASKRERAHYKINAVANVDRPTCYCDGCRVARETIAAAVPWLLDCYDLATTSLPGSAGDLS